MRRLLPARDLVRRDARKAGVGLKSCRSAADNVAMGTLANTFRAVPTWALYLAGFVAPLTFGLVKLSAMLKALS